MRSSLLMVTSRYSLFSRFMVTASHCAGLLLASSIALAQDAPANGTEAVEQPAPSDGAPSVAAPVDPWTQLPLGLNPTAVIDLAIEQGWRDHDLQPAAPASESTFCRRVHLDLIGRVPRASEVEAFLSDTDSRKRENLVDRLLSSQEHAAHLAEVLDAVLIGRTEQKDFKRRTDAGWFDYLTRAVAENRPWNQVAREIVLARPRDSAERGASWYLYARKDKAQDMAEAVSKDIFGVRIDCAQCHDHPLASEIEQKHYWGLVAFFNRSKNVDTRNGPRVSESAIGGFSDFANLQGQAQPNELVYLGERQVAEPRPAKDAKEEDRDDLYTPGETDEPRVPKFSRREQFVEVVLKDHPLLASAMVNRLWGWMFGRGLVHPVDNLDSFHPASHPGLLDWLSRDFAASGYNVRRLLRSLALARAYQLSSDKDSFVDPQWFSIGLAKPLTAEMLQRSLLMVLDPEDAGQWNSLEQRIAFARLFPDVLSEESLATVAQGLLLTNGPSINQLASPQHSRLLRNLRSVSDNRQLIERLFQSILGRGADEAELQKCDAFLSERADRRERAMSDLAWALVTSAEFRFNH